MIKTELERVLRAHRAKYPLMTPQDCVKLAYQSEYGPGHLGVDRDDFINWLLEEWNEAAAETPGGGCAIEPIGGGMSRLLLGGEPSRDAAELLADMFIRTIDGHSGSREGMDARLEVLLSAGGEDMAKYIADYRAKGCPSVHHSGAFRAAYAPHYRVIRHDLARAYELILKVRRRAERGNPVLVSIEGRCGSGKTSFAELISGFVPCRVFHADDFYLPIESRPEDWQSIPGGNMDLKRLRKEVLEPARLGEAVSLRAYDCQAGAMREAVHVPPAPVTVVEGSYSRHPDAGVKYDLTVFTTCLRSQQTARLQAREGDYYPMFETVWIPAEERYFAAFAVEENSDIVIDTSDIII